MVNSCIDDGYSYLTDRSLTRLMVALWQYFLVEKWRNERGEVWYIYIYIYIWNARKTKRRFDSRENPIKKRHVSYLINAWQPVNSDRGSCRPLWESSTLRIVNPKTLKLSTLRTLNRHPIDPSTLSWRTIGWRGQLKG